MNGLFAHLAVGGGWDTTLQVVNATSTLAGASVGIEPPGGIQASPSTIPLFSLEQNQYVGGYLGNTFTVSNIMGPHSLNTLLASETGSAATTVASATLQYDPGVGGFVRFRYIPNGQEAMVPLETRQAKTFTVAFDNTNGFTSGIALTGGTFNAIPNFAAAVSITIRDNTGKLIDSGTTTVGPGTHDSYALTDRYPSTIGQSGTIQFATTTAGQISVIGLRFPPSLRFSTIPPATEIDPGSGRMPQLAVGGGWTSTVEMINTTAATASAQLSFFNSSGSPLTLPLSFNGTTTTSSQLQQSLAPYARLVVNITGPGSGDLQFGSARFTSTAGVSGFIRYSYGALGQDVIVPLETRNAANYVVAFDNTNGASTGIALANSAGVTANIPITVYDPFGNQIAADAITLPPQGQTSYVLTDRVASALNSRGSVQFTTPVGGSISVLGIRYPISGAFTSIPVIAP